MRQTKSIDQVSRPPLRLRDLWLLFAQATTLILAAVFVGTLFFSQLLANWNSDSDPVLSENFNQGTSYWRAMRRMIPAVVSIHSSAGSGAVNSRGDSLSLGSGVIVSANGLIVTNNHVIENAESVYVRTAAGENLEATLVGTDPLVDIAVLSVSATTPLPVARFASAGKVRTGDVVVSVGSPYGLLGTATLGIVSATGRSGLGLAYYENFIQTDAAINHGSSGGALANVDGEIVGINTALFSKQLDGVHAQGIGFAIPAELVREVYEQIVRHGRLRRGWIGLTLERPSLSSVHAVSRGDALFVAAVIPGSPGNRAGVLRGDYVIRINGRSPGQIDIMEEATGSLIRPGEKVVLDLVRGAEELSVRMIAGER